MAPPVRNTQWTSYTTYLTNFIRESCNRATALASDIFERVLGQEAPGFHETRLAFQQWMETHEHAARNRELQQALQAWRAATLQLEQDLAAEIFQEMLNSGGLPVPTNQPGRLQSLQEMALPLIHRRIIGLFDAQDPDMVVLQRLL